MRDEDLIIPEVIEEKQEPMDPPAELVKHYLAEIVSVNPREPDQPDPVDHICDAIKFEKYIEIGVAPTIWHVRSEMVCPSICKYCECAMIPSNRRLFELLLILPYFLEMLKQWIS